MPNALLHPLAVAALLGAWSACDPTHESPLLDGGPPDAGVIQLVRGCLSLRPQTIDFGNVVVNTTAAASVDVTNECGVDVSVAVTDVMGTSPMPFTTVPAGGGTITISAGATITVTVQYAPVVATPEPDQAYFALGLCAEGTGCWALVAMRGTGIATGISVDPSTVDFVCPRPTPLCLTLSNLANATIHLVADPEVLNETSTGEFTPDGPFQLATTLPGDIVLLPGQSIQICISFNPPNVTKNYQGELVISTDDPTESNLVIPLVAFCGGPVILCSPFGLDFGLASIGSSSTLSVLCTNIGQDVPGHPEANLYIPDPNVGGQGLTIQNGDLAFQAAFDQPFPASGLAAGQSTKINVTYAPTMAGLDTDTLAISSNDSVNPITAISLTGTAR